MQAGHPVAYESRNMMPAECNYSTGEQELLAVVHAFKVWRPYLECGRTVTVITDHRPNIYLPTQTLKSRRKARLNELLSRFVIDRQYRPGRTNVADQLSRAPHLLALFGDGHVHPLLQDIINGYASDPWFQRARNIEPLVETDGCFIILSGQICVPDVSDIRNRLISKARDPSYRGHPGILRTTKNVQRDHWWPGMTGDIRTYVEQCVSCQMNKPTSTRPGGTLQPLPIPDTLGSALLCTSLSLSGCLKTKMEFDAILTVIDRLTKMVHFVRCHTSISAVDTADLFLDHILTLHGLPEVGRERPRFNLHQPLRREVWKSQGLKLTYSTAYQTQTDGQSERTNRTLEQYLRQYVSRRQTDWSRHLTAAEFAINNSFQESVKDTPFMLNHGLHPRIPLSVPWAFKSPVAQAWQGQVRDNLAAAKNGA